MRGVAVATANAPLADSTDFASTAMESAMPDGRPETLNTSGFATPSPVHAHSALEACCLAAGVLVLDPVTLEVLEWPAVPSAESCCPRHAR